MVNQQILDYIKQQLQQNISREQIKNSLLANNWQENDINEAFTSLDYLSSLDSLKETTSQQPERKKNKVLLTVVSVICLLLVGGGVFGYFYYFQETPEKVIEKMITNLAEIKTLEYQGEIRAEITTPDMLNDNILFQSVKPTTDKKLSDFYIDFSGKSDVSDLNNPKGSFVFNIKTNALEELTQGESIFGLDIITIGQNIYLKLSNLPNLGLFDFSFLINQWIKIDTEEMFDLENFEEQKRQQELSQEQINQIKDITAKSKVFKINEKMPSEIIEGIETHHYKFLIDKMALNNLIIEIAAIIQEETLTEKEISDFDKILEAVESIEGEIWIGKKDYLPYKLSLTIIIKETSDFKTAGKLVTTLLFKNYNKPVQIEIPTQTKSIKEILEELFNKFLGSIQVPSFDPNFQFPLQ